MSEQDENPSHVTETIALVDKMIAAGLVKPAPEPSVPTQEVQPEPIGVAAAVATVPVPDIELTAENSDEMAGCQNAMIGWCRAKIAETRGHVEELKAAYEHALKSKWKSETLKRHWSLSVKRLDFYERMLTALEHGYQIVPSFPVTAFAIRTDKKRPLKMLTGYRHANHTQEPSSIQSGEGEYKNPFPVVYERTIAAKTPTTSEVKSYWAEAWKDLEFPISMSKPRIMEAATRAMALKIFDDLGILPAIQAKGDPLIIARLLVPANRGYGPKRWVSFIVAWHLDTRTI